MAPLRVLIIGINYAPEETGNAPYTSALAAHLVGEGHEITVLTGMPHYPCWRVFPGYGSRLWKRERIEGVDVRRRWHYVPRRQSAIHRAIFELSFTLTGLSGLALPCPDAVIGIVPSLSGGILARLASHRFGAPYGLIFQDLVGQAAEQSGIAGGRRVTGTIRRLERWVAHGASSIAVVTDTFRPYLAELGIPDERVVTLPNWSHVSPPTRPRAAVREALRWRSDEYIVLHAGNMGVKQGLEHVIAAARLAVAAFPAAKFVLMGHGNQRSRLESLARDLPNVAFLDLQPGECFADVLAAADVLLVNERSTVISMALPSKLTSYFTAGRPVVAATAHGSATAREVERAGAGVVVPPEDPQALLNALAALAADCTIAERFGAAGQAYAAAHLNPERALARAAEFVACLIPGATSQDGKSGRSTPAGGCA